jgi:putative ABC transport system permease protein
LGGSSAGSDGGQSRAQALLVVSEVALSFALLVGAGLLLRSFLKLQGVDLGFNRDKVLSMQVLPPGYQYPNQGECIATYRQLRRSSGCRGWIVGIGCAAYLR